MRVPDDGLVSRNRGSDANIDTQSRDACPYSFDVKRLGAVEHGEAGSFAGVVHQRAEDCPRHRFRFHWRTNKAPNDLANSPFEIFS